MIFKREDVHIRVIDQRIGVGIGGLNTVIRGYHVPTGILVEVPNSERSHYKARETVMKMIELAVSEGGWNDQGRI